ncbi:hypothetical protein [Siminovitchia sp. 179-K 8D1 HS]|uniref:hypothetical protein n=1 Tax=Siminovitchia sp. 179-K 8D1 HS TaxID=3142385 RepID=UPI0039A373B6
MNLNEYKEWYKLLLTAKDNKIAIDEIKNFLRKSKKLEITIKVIDKDNIMNYNDDRDKT